jgi:hypothetical protein
VGAIWLMGLDVKYIVFGCLALFNALMLVIVSLFLGYGLAEAPRALFQGSRIVPTIRRMLYNSWYIYTHTHTHTPHLPHTHTPHLHHTYTPHLPHTHTTLTPHTHHTYTTHTHHTYTTHTHHTYTTHTHHTTQGKLPRVLSKRGRPR